MYSYLGLNEALIGLSKEILKEGVWRKTPGFQAENSDRCLEFPFPVTVEIRNPVARIVRILERRWNSILPYAESLWLALGWNDLDALPGKYVKSLYNFSDDGRTWRAGYGPRIRNYDDSADQYVVPSMEVESVENLQKKVRVDQLAYVVELLKKDLYTRQALITIHDPVKDSNLELVTKDQPCTRSVHFMMSAEGRLNCYVTMRSNDLLWGFSAVNVFNFTFMQEYIAKLLGVEVGRYYHVAHNLHVYEKFIPRIRIFADYDCGEGEELDSVFFSDSIPFEYAKDMSSLDHAFMQVLSFEREAFRQNENALKELFEFVDQQTMDPFFLEWSLAFFLHTMRDKTRQFTIERKMNIQYL